MLLWEARKNMTLFAYILVCFLARELLQVFYRSGRTLESMNSYTVKYWYCEDQITFTDCTNLSCTVHAHMNFVAWKKCSFSNTSPTILYFEKYWVLQECSKFSHFLIFPRNYFDAEIYLGMSLITLYNCLSAWQKVNRFVSSVGRYTSLGRPHP